MKNILILLFALFAVALKADDRTVPGRTLSVTPQNALIHLPEFRKRSYKVFIQDEKGIWQPIEVRNALVSSFSKHPQIWNDWENQKLLRDTMSYALFVRDFAKNVKVRVEPCFRFRNVEIRPVSYGIDYKRGSVPHSVRFDPGRPRLRTGRRRDGRRTALPGGQQPAAGRRHPGLQPEQEKRIPAPRLCQIGQSPGQVHRGHGLRRRMYHGSQHPQPARCR